MRPAPAPPLSIQNLPSPFFAALGFADAPDYARIRALLMSGAKELNLSTIQFDWEAAEEAAAAAGAAASAFATALATAAEPTSAAPEAKRARRSQHQPENEELARELSKSAINIDKCVNFAREAGLTSCGSYARLFAGCPAALGTSSWRRRS